MLWQNDRTSVMFIISYHNMKWYLFLQHTYRQFYSLNFHDFRDFSVVLVWTDVNPGLQIIRNNLLDWCLIQHAACASCMSSCVVALQILQYTSSVILCTCHYNLCGPRKKLYFRLKMEIQNFVFHTTVLEIIGIYIYCQ